MDSHISDSVSYTHLRGFQEVITPGLEFFDIFSLECAGIPQESMYKLTDHKGRLLVLRPDSTLPIARMTATRLQNEKRPLRLYYTQTVYRNNPSLMGRSDEVMQTGIELLGASGKRADLEVIVTAVEALSRCVPDFRMELGLSLIHILPACFPQWSRALFSR